MASGPVREQPSQSGRPPPLPPRSSNRMSDPHLADDFEALTLHHPDYALVSQDPRSSSTQSLVPPAYSEHDGRRTLLLIYMHGFMGDETSFQSFPAHLHNLLAVTLADSHVVHTKIYPKYRTRHTIDVATNAFSEWLTPHESPTTDVILLGHSMGGLLAADIAMLPSNSSYPQDAFRHRILGLINFDVPFLGMHPGVVKSGLSSLFRGKDDSPGRPSDNTDSYQNQVLQSSSEPNINRPSRMNTLFAPRPSDPTYNPVFENDVRLPERKGWESMLHFVSKHSDGLVQATKNYVASHLEFGGAMAHYSALKDRYSRIRSLEEEDGNSRPAALRFSPRIRFVNYYTASTGRPKKPKSPSPSASPSRLPEGSRPEHSIPTNIEGSKSHEPLSQLSTPRISLEEHRDHDVVTKTPEEPLSASSDQMDRSQPPSVMAQDRSSVTSLGSMNKGSDPDLPPIPDVPEVPAYVDLTQYSDKETRKAAEKEHDKALKAYKAKVKERNAVIRERAKIEEKRKKAAEKEEQRRQKDSIKEEEMRKKEKERTAPSWEEIWAADRAREAKQREFEAQSRGVEAPGRTKSMEDAKSGIRNADEVPQKDGSSSRPSSPYYLDESDILSTGPPVTRLDSGSRPASSHGLGSPSAESLRPESPSKPKKLRKFCMLPPKDGHGHKDPTWIPVVMEGVDEVGAHCGLFFVGEPYERLLGEAGAKIEEWVKEDMSNRLVRELSGS